MILQDVVISFIDAIALLGRANQQITNEHKDRLKASLSEDYRNICGQDHSDYKLLFGDDLIKNIRRVKAPYYLN